MPQFTDEEILSDLRFVDDIKGPAKIVFWRGLDFGFVRPLVGRRHFDAETRKKHNGEWYDPFMFRGFHQTAELAACELVRRKIAEDPDGELIQAALRHDTAFIDEWRQRQIDSIETVDDA